jgi:hypothetical protein
VRGKKDHCKFAQRAVVVIGDGRGKFIDVCTANTECKTHWKWEIETAARDAKTRTATKAGTRATHSPKAAAADKKAKEKRQAEQAHRELREQVLAVVVKRFEKVAPKTPTALLPLLAEAVGDWGKPATTWKALAMQAVERLKDDCFGDAEYKTLGKLLKPFGLDLAVLERELAPKDAQTSASKKAKKS